MSVDVAKGKSVFMIVNSNGEVVMDCIEIKHNLEEFEKLKNKIEEHKFKELTVFMESTGIYHLPVERYFKENGFKTIVINSLTTKNNYDTLRKTKTDKKDCYRLARLFFVNEVVYHDLSKKGLYANLKALSRQYFYLTQKNVSCKNRYKRLINICFPEIEEIFKSNRIYDDTALNFVTKFPHASIIAETRMDVLYNNMYKTNGRHINMYKTVANKIKEKAKRSYPGVDKNHADVNNLSNMAKIVKSNNEIINQLKNEMIELAKQSPYFEIINSIYGIGETFAAEILGELGDITRFESHKELIAFCGLDPTIMQSGKTINVHGTISKRGNKYVRYILFNCSKTMVKLGSKYYPDHPIFVYYQKKKAEGKHYYESLTACLTKILRMLYSMCKNNKQFLEN